MIRKVRLLAWAPVVSVALMIVAMYSSWVVAYAQLGRRPRPSVDDPNMIGGFSTDLYDFSLPFVFVLFVIWAVTSAFTILMAGLLKTEHWRGWALGFVAGLVTFGPVFRVRQATRLSGSSTELTRSRGVRAWFSL